jgi:hypothetical protein
VNFWCIMGLIIFHLIQSKQFKKSIIISKKLLLSVDELM